MYENDEMMNFMLIKKYTFSLILVFLMFAIFAYFSGIREGGFDYNEYIIMFNNIQNQDDIFNKLSVAKDPIVGIIVYFVDRFICYKVEYVFLFIAFLGTFVKILGFSSIKEHLFTFTFCYILLLSPGLDYSAIRAMLALSFFGLALHYKSIEKFTLYVFFLMLSIISHISFLVIAILSFDQIQKIIVKHKFLIIFSVVFFGFNAKYILGLFPNTITYINDTGTVYSILPSLLMLCAVYLYKIKLLVKQSQSFNNICFNIAFVTLILSIVIAPLVVVASFRFLQISQYVFLLSLCSTKTDGNKNKALLLSLVVIIYAIPILFRNYSLGLWLPIIQNI